MMTSLRKAKHKVKYNFCVFCKNNGEDETVYLGHTLKDDWGNVTCPILFHYVCPICHASGNVAHTVKYCPENKEGAGGVYNGLASITELKRLRTSTGRPPRPLVNSVTPTPPMSPFGGMDEGIEEELSNSRTVCRRCLFTHPRRATDQVGSLGGFYYDTNLEMVQDFADGRSRYRREFSQNALAFDGFSMSVSHPQQFDCGDGGVNSFNYCLPLGSAPNSSGRQCGKQKRPILGIASPTLPSSSLPSP